MSCRKGSENMINQEKKQELDIDSLCYGCIYYTEDGCECLELCVEGDMITISS